MSFKTMTIWETKPPEYPGWYNTLVVNNSGIPEVMTMRWNKETGWDNKSWEVRGWCTFPLTCEFMGDNPKVISEDPEVTNEDPENTPDIFDDLTQEEKIVNLAEDLLEIFCGKTHDAYMSGTIVKQIIIEYIRNGGTHADK